VNPDLPVSSGGRSAPTLTALAIRSGSVPSPYAHGVSSGVWGGRPAAMFRSLAIVRPEGRVRLFNATTRAASGRAQQEHPRQQQHRRRQEPKKDHGSPPMPATALLPAPGSISASALTRPEACRPGSAAGKGVRAIDPLA